MMQKYEAPKLTKYGRVENFIQAGSAALASGDVTGDGLVDQAFDTNGDGRADEVVGNSGATTPVNFIANVTGRNDINADFYDSDGDGQADIAIADLNTPNPTLQTIDLNAYAYVRLSDSASFYSYGNVGTGSNATETSFEGGWSDPARD